jgi:hypothetical protein
MTSRGLQIQKFIAGAIVVIAVVAAALIVVM